MMSSEFFFNNTWISGSKIIIFVKEYSDFIHIQYALVSRLIDNLRYMYAKVLLVERPQSSLAPV